MAQRFYNNARGVLAGPVIEIDDTLVLQDHVGLPTSLPAGDWFSLTVLNETSRYGSNLEIMKVTGVTVSGSNLELVVARGQDGTAAVAHDGGEKAEARITRMSIEALLADANGYTDSEVAALLDAAPGALDTLNELAAALGDDPDFATTMTNALADKVAKSHLTESDPHTQYAKEGDLGTAAGGTLTTSKVSNQEGRVLRVGDYGIGSSAPILEDLNERSFIGEYRVTTSTLNIADRPAGTENNAHVSIKRFNGDWLIQTFQSINGYDQWFRMSNPTSWGAWRRIYNSSDVVGTVSQSGGVPTGAVIEWDTNSDGEYLKLADGTLWNFKTVTGLGPINTQEGSIYRYFVGTASMGSWAHPFIAARPTVSATSYNPVDGSYSWIARQGASNETLLNSFSLFRPTAASSTGFCIDVMAKGRWYA